MELPPFRFSPLVESDLPFFLEIRNDCRAMLHDDRFFTYEECLSWFRAHHPEYYIIEHAGNRIGYFRVSNRDPASRSLYVGADLHPRFRGKGLATKAYESFLPWIKEREGLRAVQLEVLSHNTIARALYEKLAFVEVGRRDAVAERDGDVVHSIIMEKVF